MEEKLNLYQRINAVMKDIEYLQKDDKVVTNQSTGAGYKAVSEEKVTSEIRKGLVKHGIVIIPVWQAHKREDEQVTGYKNEMKTSRLTTVDVTYRIQNIDDKDDYIEAVSSGTGVDTQDKGVGKAMTYAYKYLLLRTFAIPTGEDPDKVSSEVYTESLKGKTNSTSKKEEKEIKILDSQKEKIKELYKPDEIKEYLITLEKKKISDLTVQEASNFIKKKAEEK